MLLNIFRCIQYCIAEVIPLDEDYDGGENRVAELLGAGDIDDDGIEIRGTDVKIRGSGKIRTGKRPHLQIQIDDGRYGDIGDIGDEPYGDSDDARNTKFKDNNRFTGGRGNQQQYDQRNQQQYDHRNQQQYDQRNQHQYDDGEQTTELPSPRGVRRPEQKYKNKHPLRPTRGELAEAAFWRAFGLGFPLNIFGLGLGGYGALGGHRNFGLFF